MTSGYQSSEGLFRGIYSGRLEQNMETTISGLWFRIIIRILEKHMEKAVDMKCRMGLYRGLKGLSIGYPYIYISIYQESLFGSLQRKDRSSVVCKWDPLFRCAYDRVARRPGDSSSGWPRTFAENSRRRHCLQAVKHDTEPQKIDRAG